MILVSRKVLCSICKQKYGKQYQIFEMSLTQEKEKSSMLEFRYDTHLD